MPVEIVVGGQWGDEGKGKIVDTLAGRADMVVRATGGSNAGHTVENELGKFALHLIPSGIFSSRLNVIGNGVVVEPGVLFREMDELLGRGIALDSLRISDRAHLVLPYHPVLDQADEQASGEAAIGTTGRGIGPAYVDKVARKGLRIADLYDETHLTGRLVAHCEAKNELLRHLYGRAAVAVDRLLEECRATGQRLRPHVVESEQLVQQTIAAGGLVLVEGAQAALLDVEFGTYPYVTSSSPSAAGMCMGAGIAPTQVSRVIGVYKAYCSRVGNGPFPTEQANRLGDELRQHAHEYGTTTGRPRRVGWFDAAACRGVLSLNGVREIALTRLDILGILPELKICTHYQLGGQRLDHLPARGDLLTQLEPVYEELPGWRSDISSVRYFEDLPGNARRYVERIEALLGVPVTMIGVGPARDQTIERPRAALTQRDPVA